MAPRTYRLDEARSLLAALRSLIPDRPLRFSEALRVAEWQATRLRELTGVEDGPAPSEIISELPRIRITYRAIPTSGASYWDGSVWVICLNRAEPSTRQRFTLFHEFKHILDHGRASQLYCGSTSHSPDEQAEQAADYFAGCALMPRRCLKRAWAGGIQRPGALAKLFDVSPRAIEVRLAQIGLSEPLPRCTVDRPLSRRPRPGRYHRDLSIHWPVRLEGANA